MKVATGIKELREAVNIERKAGKIIGLVPTMGYLHEGHLSLVKAAQKTCGFVVVSIFVNPAQFAPGEDFEVYPRDIERDERLLKAEGVDLLFYPAGEEMYPDGYKTMVEVKDLSDLLCGAYRPGHFIGVATVVLKLFNQVKPDRVFFGEKDAQQLLIIKKMAKDLDLDLEIIGVPTVREEDGLAKSSRNVYLNPRQRKAAVFLFRGLKAAKDLIEKGERNSQALRSEMVKVLEQEPLIKLQYLELVGQEDLKPQLRIEGKILVALAAFLGKTRLIDNFMLEVKE